MSKQVPQTSVSALADLDWSQVRETVLMLHFAVSFIQQGLRDGDDSVNALTESFTDMVKNTGAISDDIALISDQAVKEKVMARCDVINEKMQAAIVAFQFYDKLTQRFEHVSSSMSALGDLVSDPDRIFNPNQWNQLQDDIKSKFTIAEDRQAFDDILKGKSLKDVLKSLGSGPRESNSESEIELF